MDEVLTVQETAAYLKVSRSTVWRWCNNKKIPAFKVGRSWRISRVALDKFMEAGGLQDGRKHIRDEVRSNVAVSAPGTSKKLG